MASNAFDRVYQVALPFKRGTIEVDASRFTPTLQILTVQHGLNQKAADTACKFKVEPTNPEDREKGVAYFDTQELREDAIVDAIKNLIEESWYKGKWNRDGSARGTDPIDATIFGILFVRLGILREDQAAHRKMGIETLVGMLVQKDSKKKLSGKAFDAKRNERVAELRAKAEQIMALTLG
jgi:hypothetical protein